MYTWGDGSLGQLGHGSLEPERTPQRLEGALASDRVDEVACGAGHTLAIIGLCCGCLLVMSEWYFCPNFFSSFLSNPQLCEKGFDLNPLRVECESVPKTTNNEETTANNKDITLKHTFWTDSILVLAPIPDMSTLTLCDILN